METTIKSNFALLLYRDYTEIIILNGLRLILQTQQSKVI